MATAASCVCSAVAVPSYFGCSPGQRKALRKQQQSFQRASIVVIAVVGMIGQVQGAWWDSAALLCALLLNMVRTTTGRQGSGLPCDNPLGQPSDWRRQQAHAIHDTVATVMHRRLQLQLSKPAHRRAMLTHCRMCPLHAGRHPAYRRHRSAALRLRPLAPEPHTRPQHIGAHAAAAGAVLCVPPAGPGWPAAAGAGATCSMGSAAAAVRC